jgi:hypothetical protein
MKFSNVMKVEFCENYDQEIIAAKKMLNNPQANYGQLFEKVCKLERLYGGLQLLISLELRSDIINLWRIASVSRKIQRRMQYAIQRLRKLH